MYVFGTEKLCPQMEVQLEKSEHCPGALFCSLMA